MATHALFDMLQDFGSRPYPATAPHGTPQRTDPHAAVSQADIIRAEIARAEAELERRLTLAHAAAIETEQRNHADEIDAMQRRFGETAGNAIAARLDDMQERIGELAAAAAARILGSILSEELQKRSLESLAQSIRGAVTDFEAVRIGVRGPQSLYETLSTALGERAASLDFTEAPGFDLTVTIDGNLFETRLSEWSVALSEILA